MLHPHVGTMIEKGHEVQRVLDGSSISLCLDTGHLLIGGTDPAELARRSSEPDRPPALEGCGFGDCREGAVRWAQPQRRGRAGNVSPTGDGDVDVPAIVGYLRAQGYDGWYTLEQDTILTEEPTEHGPVEDVAASADYLRSVLGHTG